MTKKSPVVIKRVARRSEQVTAAEFTKVEALVRTILSAKNIQKVIPYRRTLSIIITYFSVGKGTALRKALASQLPEWSFTNLAYDKCSKNMRLNLRKKDATQTSALNVQKPAAQIELKENL